MSLLLIQINFGILIIMEMDAPTDMFETLRYEGWNYWSFLGKRKAEKLLLILDQLKTTYKHLQSKHFLPFSLIWL